MKVDGNIIERPQYMLMRVALGIHGNDFENAFKSGSRSFLVYTENAHVDARNRIVRMKISTPHQVTSWKPKTQLSLELDARPQVQTAEELKPAHH